MKTRTKDYREKIADKFIESLSENPGKWQQDWRTVNCSPYNPITNVHYRGVNRFWLSFIQMKEGFDDPRWCTFKQIADNGWHLQKGSKSTQVEYWFPYDCDEKKRISWSDYNNLEDKSNIQLLANYYNVFNACRIDGIPELEKTELQDINQAEIVSKIANGMGVEIINDGGNDAFYRPSEDKIHLPNPGYFYDDYGYNATALHELSHATGHASRLNRYLNGGFGSEYYAYEELVAELSSCFMSEELPVEMTEDHFNNHKAYIQGWISAIQKQPEILMKAIKDAEKAADYLEEKAGLISMEEFKKLAERTLSVSKNIVKDYEQTEKENIGMEEINRKGYVKDYLSAFFERYDFEHPVAIKGSVLPSFIMAKELEQGGMFTDEDECRAWINNDPEAAMNTLSYVEDKFKELENFTPETNPKRFSLIMMEREIYKMIYDNPTVDKNWDTEFLFDKETVSQICKDNGIKIPEAAKVQQMQVEGFELE